MTSEAIAAWVQAIGSIAAVAAAFLISSCQFNQAIRLQERQYRSEERRRYQALTALVEAALKEFGETLTKMRGPEPERWFAENSTKEMMEELSTAFMQISPLELPSPLAVRALVTLRDRLKTAAWNANAALEHGTERYQEYMECVAAMEDNINELRSEHLKLVAELSKLDPFDDALPLGQTDNLQQTAICQFVSNVRPHNSESSPTVQNYK